MCIHLQVEMTDCMTFPLTEQVCWQYIWRGPEDKVENHQPCLCLYRPTRNHRLILSLSNTLENEFHLSYTFSSFNAFCFTPFFFNAPCQFTSLLNLRSIIFILTPSGWLRSVNANLLFLRGSSLLIFTLLMCTCFLRNTYRA